MAFQRSCRAYGTRVERLIGDARSLQALGEEVAPGLYEAELQYLKHREWSRTGEDVLWRRSKLGLRLNEAQRARVAEWFS